MNRSSILLPLLLLIGSALPLPAHAKRSGDDDSDHRGGDHHVGEDDKGSGRKGDEDRARKPVALRLSLKPAPGASVDLVGARGRIDYKAKDGKVDFKGSLWVVVPSPSLGISDVASAAGAALSLEFIREGVVYSTCSLRTPSHVSQEDSAPNLHFQVQGNKASKKKGVRFQKGSCSDGLPSIRKGDTVKGFATVGGTRVEVVSR